MFHFPVLVFALLVLTTRLGNAVHYAHDVGNRTW